MLAAGAAVVSAAGASGVAGRPAGSPDLAAMALALTDLPRGSEVEDQGYYRDPDYVAAYAREFAVGGARLGRSGVLAVIDDLSVERSEAGARASFDSIRVVFGTKSFRQQLARELAREADLPQRAVTVGRPRSSRIGDGALSVSMRIKDDGFVVNMVITVLRVDRVLAALTYVSFPMRRIYNADVDRFTRVSAARMIAGLVPTLKAQATVAGTTQPGQVLSANRGTWTGDQLAFDYQWQRCDSAGAGCSRIPGAAAATYTVTAGDLASTLRVDVVGRNRLGSVTSSSAVTTVVAGPPGSPTATAAPLVAGSAQVGAVLTVDAGGWAAAPTALAYQWRRCDASGGACVDIAGATASTYTVATTDSRSTLRVLVVATSAAGAGGAISAATPVIP